MSTKKAALLASASAAALTEAALQQILTAAKTAPDMQDLHNVVTILSHTGIRSGELERMRWSDVDLAASHLVIQPHRFRGRTVHFDAQTLLALEALRQRHPESELVLGNTPIRFLHRMSKQLGTLSAQTGLRPVTFQALRQVFCMRLVNAGASAVTIMAITDCALSSLVRYLTTGGDQELRRGYEAGPNKAS